MLQNMLCIPNRTLKINIVFKRYEYVNKCKKIFYTRVSSHRLKKSKNDSPSHILPIRYDHLFITVNEAES